MTAASAEHLRPAFSGGIGALICGRRVFHMTGGWGGHHPVGAPVFCVNHSPAATAVTPAWHTVRSPAWAVP